MLWNTAINNAGGTIQAVGAQANVDLQSVSIEGGTLTTSGGGVIQTVDTGSTLDGITSGVLTNSGTVVVNDSMMLSLMGTIANSGTIMESGFGNTGNTRLRLTGPVTLTGAGQVLLSDNANNQVFATGSLFMLTNQGNLISGAGQFGAGGMDYDNKSGTIRGTGTNNALVINLGQGTGLNEAAGSITANGAGGVILTSGYFTNNGVMAANNGSTMTFQSGAVNVNLAEGDLVGGTWRAISTGLGATFTISGSAAGGGAVVNDGAIIRLQGAGSVIQSFDPTSATIKPLEQTMTSVASGGQLQVLANRGYTSGLNFTDSGIVQLGGGTFQTNSLSVTSGAKFFGFGTVQDSVSNAGLIEVNTGTLTVTGSISGAGTLQADAGTTLVLTGPSIQAAKVTDHGTVSLGGWNRTGHHTHCRQRCEADRVWVRPECGDQRRSHRGQRRHAHGDGVDHRGWDAASRYWGDAGADRAKQSCVKGDRQWHREPRGRNLEGHYIYRRQRFEADRVWHCAECGVQRGSG